MACEIDLQDQVVKIGKGAKECSFWCYHTPEGSRNDIPDLL